MLVFISYPRELEKFAEKLCIQLNNRNIPTFRDLDNIGLGEIWNKKIEDNIEKADLFVVLYSAKAIEDRKGFLGIEIDRIEKKCRKNNNPGLITIVFPPTRTEDLKPYFKTRQYHIASEYEDEAHHWIDKILQEVSRLEINQSDEKNPSEIQKKLEFKWIISLLIIFMIVGGFTSLKTNYPINQSPMGESVCNSLRGKYELDHEYIFSWGTNSRSIATHDTTWHTTDDNCSFNEKDDLYTLKGLDKTNFDVETIIEGKYVRIATILLSYGSEVHINNSDGKLVDRIFNAVVPAEDVKKEDIRVYPNGINNELTKRLTDDFIYKKTYEVLKARYELHRKIRSKGCSPMLGYIGARTAISFVCPHYTRVMVKIN